jgi:hypothetical protein
MSISLGSKYAESLDGARPIELIEMRRLMRVYPTVSWVKCDLLTINVCTALVDLSRNGFIPYKGYEAGRYKSSGERQQCRDVTNHDPQSARLLPKSPDSIMS